MASFLQLICQKLSIVLYPPLCYSFLSFFFFVLFIFKWFFTSTTKKSIQPPPPPSPPKLPILGNLHQLGSYPHRSLHSLAQRHGQLMLLHLGSTPTLVVSSATAAQEIMKTRDLIFSNRPKLSIFGKLAYNYQDVATAPYGEYLRQMRSICVLQLLSNKRVHSFQDVREEEVALLIEEIEQYCLISSNSPPLPQPPLDLSKKFASLTNNVVCRVALGRKYNNERKFNKMMVDLVVLLGGFYVRDFIPWLSWVNCVNGLDAKVDRVAKEFDSFFDEVVDEHMKKGFLGKDKDFVYVLLEVQKKNNLGFSIDKVSIKALILDMFAAGTDTTYTALEWTMTELLRHPKVMKKLQNEVRGVARGKPIITESDIEKMSYLKAVLKETLRLHPPVPLLVPRESTQDIKIMGYNIAAGTLVITNAWAIGRNPESWDEPNEFRPERFRNSSVDFKGQNFELIPFGAGRRGCPGILFGISIYELALTNLVNKFNWALPGGVKEQDLDMTESAGFSIHRKLPLLAVPTPYSY